MYKKAFSGWVHQYDDAVDFVVVVDDDDEEDESDNGPIVGADFTRYNNKTNLILTQINKLLIPPDWFTLFPFTTHHALLYFPCSYTY